MGTHRTKRDMLKRHIGHAWTNIERAQSHMLYVKEVFDPVHPDYGELLEAGVLMMEQALGVLKAFATHAWGGMPEKVERWTNTGYDWRHKQEWMQAQKDLPQTNGEREQKPGCPPSSPESQR